MPSALLLIDLQRDFLQGPRLTPHPAALIDAVASLLERFRRSRAPIFHVITSVTTQQAGLPHWQSRGLTRCVPGTAGHTAPEPLTPTGTEPVFHKRWYSGCEDPGLVSALRMARVETVYLCGVHWRACLRSTAIDLSQAGFQVVLVDEACGDDDPVHGMIVRDWLLTRFCRAASLAQVLHAIEPEDAGAGINQQESVPLPAPNPAPNTSPANWHYAPATQEPLYPVDSLRTDGIQQATALCRSAALPWSHTPISRRIEHVRKIAEGVEQQSEAFARLITRETGKPVVDARLEVGFGVALVREVCSRAAERLTAESGPGWQMVRRPHGTVAVITPWNNPLAIPLGKLAPALVYGNAVAWKPAPAGLGLARALAALCSTQGLPHGLVTLIPGDRQTAELLIRDPAVDAVTLTGSEAAGISCQIESLRRAIPCQAELGGNNAAVLWDPVDREAALQQTARGAFGGAGQRCTANRRLIVPRIELAPIVARLVEITRTLPWGDPHDEATFLGPVISAIARDRLTALTARTRHAGHTVITPHLEGEFQGTAERRGWYVPPTLVVCDDPQAEIVQEEAFGPLLVIQPADDWNQALQLCDHVRQGLVASLWTRDSRRQHEFLSRVRVGLVKFNQSTAGATAAAPFGGWKHSGFGPPEHGCADVEFYTRIQSIYSTDEIPRPPTEVSS
ncbi:MAG: aldehyde dehydrogenase family protein [Planctomycetaceae bacterium]|jgi:acyl-CoA reductase-like NAD-dependent aldehyde dehydrogenase/nicotinamidase-related amidase